MKKKQNQALIGFGSNLGNRIEYLFKAIKYLNAAEGKCLNVAQIQYSKPLGAADMDFINTVLLYETTLEPFALLEKLLNIEKILGRTREVSWGNRCIDLDLLLFRPYDKANEILADCLIIQNNALTLPHPEMHKRDFVLVPAVEVAADWLHPQLNKTLQQIKLEHNYDTFIQAQDTTLSQLHAQIVQLI